MTRKLLSLTISRVDAPIFDGEVVSVTLPGIGGEMTLLALHTPLITPLKKGIITVRKSDNTEEQFTIESGTVEISNNHATVLV